MSKETNAFEKIAASVELAKEKDTDFNFFDAPFLSDQAADLDEPLEKEVVIKTDVELEDIDATTDEPKVTKNKNEQTGVDEITINDYADYSDFSILALQEIKNGNLDISEEDLPKDLDSVTFFELIKAQNQTVLERQKEELLAQVTEYSEYVKHIMEGGNPETINYLAAIKQVTDLDVDSEEDQKVILKTYFQLRDMEEDVIEDTIEALFEKGKGRAKSQEAVEAMKKYHDSVLENERAQQKEIQRQRQEEYEKYVDSITTIVKKGSINGVKIPKEKQSQIIDAMFKPTETIEQYNPQTGKKEKTKVTKSKVLFDEVNRNPEKLVALTMWLLEGGDFSSVKEEMEVKANNKLLAVLNNRSKSQKANVTGFEDIAKQVAEFRR